MPESQSEQLPASPENIESTERKTQRLLDDAKNIVSMFESHFSKDGAKANSIRKEYQELTDRYDLAKQETTEEQSWIAQNELNEIRKEYMDVVNLTTKQESFFFSAEDFEKNPSVQERVKTSIDMFFNSSVSFQDLSNKQIARILSWIHALNWEWDEYTQKLQNRMLYDTKWLAKLSSNWATGQSTDIDRFLAYEWKIVNEIVKPIKDSLEEVVLWKTVDGFITEKMKQFPEDDQVDFKRDIVSVFNENKTPTVDSIRNIMTWVKEAIKKYYLWDENSQYDVLALSLANHLITFNTGIQLWIKVMANGGDLWQLRRNLQKDPKIAFENVSAQYWVDSKMSQYITNALRLSSAARMAEKDTTWEIASITMRMLSEVDENWDPKFTMNDVYATIAEKWKELGIVDEAGNILEEKVVKDEKEELVEEKISTDDYDNSNKFVNGLVEWEQTGVPWVVWMDVVKSWSKYVISFKSAIVECSQENVDDVLDVAKVLLPNKLDFFLPKLDEIVHNLENTNHKSSLEKLKSDSKEIKDEWTVELLKLFCLALFDEWWIDEDKFSWIVSRVKAWSEKIKTLTTVHDINNFLETYEADVSATPLDEIARMQWFISWNEFQTNIFMDIIGNTWTSTAKTHEKRAK